MQTLITYCLYHISKKLLYICNIFIIKWHPVYTLCAPCSPRLCRQESPLKQMHHITQTVDPEVIVGDSDC